jgi:hypothetical protein
MDAAGWSDKELHKIENVRTLEKMNFYTLSSLVDYIKSQVDVPNEFVNHLFINITSPEHISVISEANAGNYDKRAHIADVTAMIPVVKIGKWVDQVEFCIMMRANFIDEEADTDMDALISMASNVVSGTIAQYEDTGISQKATIKTGIQEQEDRILPDKVTLRPYRTFLEVEQPKSEFLFRAQDDKYAGIQFSIHEADGGRWKLDAMASIKAYLEEQLAGLDYITITA